MDITKNIIASIGVALQNLQFSQTDIQLEHPADESHGDYSTNIALKLKSEEFKNPREIASKIIKELEKDEALTKIVSKIEVAGPGFINFWLNKEYLISLMNQINIIKNKYGDNNYGEEKKFSLEHTSPNTNKPLHVGHARNPILGMSLVEILRKCGYRVISTDINNDRGMPIMKSVWAYQKYGNNLTPETITSQQWNEIAKKAEAPNMNPYMINTKVKPDHFVGLFYVVGHLLSEKEESIKSEISDLVLKWESGDDLVRALWEKMNNWFYEGNKISLDRLGVYFDKEWYESDVYNNGKEIVEDGVKRKIFKKFPDGHVEAELEAYGLPNVVLLRSNGTALYITQDIELVRRRIVEDENHYNYIQTSYEQNLRFRQLYKICEMLGYGSADQFIHVGYGMVNLPEGKMSSRLGNTILLDDLMDTMVQLSKNLISSSKDNISEVEKDIIAKTVGISALKYSMLKVDPLKDIAFDLEKSVAMEGNSGPYLQYTYARCQSVLRKGGEKNDELSMTNYDLLEDELHLLRTLYRFPEVVLGAGKTFSPNLIANYLYELAQKYNLFYQKVPILQSSEEEKRFRLALTLAVAQVLKNGLGLLGIPVLEKM